MNKKIFIIFVLGIFFISFISATLPPVKQNECINIRTILNATTVNISTITYPTPNQTILFLNNEMTKNGKTFNYSFCETLIIGTYVYDYFDNEGNVYVNDFEVTYTGEEVNSTQGFILLAQIGIIALLFGMGRVFNKNKWKIKMFFDLMATLMAFILLNSIKIVSSQSGKLNQMGEMGIYIGFVMIGFIFLYLFINATIEVINYFKMKKQKKWSINFYAN